MLLWPASALHRRGKPHSLEYETGDDRRIRVPQVEPIPRRRMGFTQLMQKMLLARYAPAAVLINRKYEVLSLFGRTSDYLELPTGELTTDLMSLAARLRTPIRAACQKVLNGGDTLASSLRGSRGTALPYFVQSPSSASRAQRGGRVAARRYPGS